MKRKIKKFRYLRWLILILWVVFAPSHFSQAVVASKGISPDLTRRYAQSGRQPLSVLSYNVFLRPPLVDGIFLFKDNARCRAPLIGQQLREKLYDVVALQETQHGSALVKMLTPMLDSYPYRILRQPDAFAWEDTRAVDGGVSLLSRYPIEFWQIVPFRECTREDCLARKGFVHALLKLNASLKVNVLATHTNAGPYAEVRQAQLEQLQDYMSNTPLIKQWPTLIVGDLNVNALGPVERTESEYQWMHELLSTPLGPPTDVLANFWRGAEAFEEITHTRNCVDSRIRPCISPNRFDLRELRRRYDYILYYDHPRYGIDVQHAATLEFADKTERCGSPYLSDHKAISALFELRW